MKANADSVISGISELNGNLKFSFLNVTFDDKEVCEVYPNSSQVTEIKKDIFFIGKLRLVFFFFFLLFLIRSIPNVGFL